VEKIRAGRSQGGLRPQHLTGIQLLAQLSEAKLHNGNIGATEIFFTPRTIKGGNYLADTKTAGYFFNIKFLIENEILLLLGVSV